MKPILIINTDLGWDNVAHILDAEEMTEAQFEEVEKICERDCLVMVDWQSVSSVESFLLDYK